MTNSRQATNIHENDYLAAELEASQTRPTRVSRPHSAVCELSGESSVLTQSDVQAAPVPAGGDILPQANPWPFYLDDASSTLPAHGRRPPSNATSGTNQEPANPWPYHGVESDSLNNDNVLKHREDARNVIDLTISSGEQDKKSPRKPRAELLDGKDAVEPDAATEQSHDPLRNSNHAQKGSNVAGTALQFEKSEPMAPKPLPGKASTYAHTGSDSNSPATTVPESQVSANVHCDGISETLSNSAPATQSASSRVNEDNGTTPETSSDFANATTGLQGEYLMSACSPPNRQIQNSASNETLLSRPALQSSNGSYPYPPPYPSQEDTPVACEIQNVENYYRGQHSYPHTADTAQPTPGVLSADESFQRRPLSPGPRLRPEAPPLPPRSPRHTTSVLGLSEGPHSNVAFPPPPKRHNVPPARHPPPLPQRPTTSSSSSFPHSKFMGSSSAMKWIEKTNQAIEDRLDAVLQGPAGHPSRPAYTNRPQQSGHNTPRSYTNRHDQTR